MLHLHLDPLGGLAGDMFAACLLDAFPQHAAAVIEAAQGLGGVACRLLPHDDGILTGARFDVAAPHQHDHDHDQGHGHAHGHTHWRGIRSRLQAGLPEAVAAHAVGIFAGLAAAEAQVHGVAADEVVFHEVGAADSIADIVAAASLIEALGAARWSVGALPLGGGRVQTAHGPMPVPAPATTLLLDGFEMVDDGIGGERVTPTGAAILRYLRESGRLQTRRGGRLGATGIGFGTRRLPGISNCLRVLALETDEVAAEAGSAAHRRLAVVAFEVDDQSGEDLAAGLERLRAVDGVHDVLQMPAIGKKGRMTMHVQLLAAPEAMEAAVAACFGETTTIGLRCQIVEGRALAREMRQVSVEGRSVQVKLVERPGQRTGKAEADHVLALPGHAARARLRRLAEAAAEAGDGA